jgi:mannose-6-phosphate isomerase
VRAGDSTFVPSGTIHAIGAGLVIVEIQQRSDVTFRLFDYGRDRELHVDIGVAAASADQGDPRAPPRKLTGSRTVLVAGPCFVLERLALASGRVRDLGAEKECWLFVLAGRGRVGSLEVASGTAVFLEADRVRMEAGPDGLSALVGYVGSSPAPDLLRRLSGARARDPARAAERPRPLAKPAIRSPPAGAAS